jgi:hypothetical protein
MAEIFENVAELHEFIDPFLRINNDNTINILMEKDLQTIGIETLYKNYMEQPNKGLKNVLAWLIQTICLAHNTVPSSMHGYFHYLDQNGKPPSTIPTFHKSIIRFDSLRRLFQIAREEYASLFQFNLTHIRDHRFDWDAIRNSLLTVQTAAIREGYKGYLFFVLDIPSTLLNAPISNNVLISELETAIKWGIYNFTFEEPVWEAITRSAALSSELPNSEKGMYTLQKELGFPLGISIKVPFYKPSGTSLGLEDASPFHSYTHKHSLFWNKRRDGIIPSPHIAIQWDQPGFSSLFGEKLGYLDSARRLPLKLYGVPFPITCSHSYSLLGLFREMEVVADSTLNLEKDLFEQAIREIFREWRVTETKRLAYEHIKMIRLYQSTPHELLSVS